MLIEMVKKLFLIFLTNNKNVNWNVKNVFFSLAAFDWIKRRSEAATTGVLLKLN